MNPLWLEEQEEKKDEQKKKLLLVQIKCCKQEIKHNKISEQKLFWHKNSLTSLFKWTPANICKKVLPSLTQLHNPNIYSHTGVGVK